jgi:hypothetical protein
VIKVIKVASYHIKSENRKNITKKKKAEIKAKREVVEVGRGK